LKSYINDSIILHRLQLYLALNQAIYSKIIHLSRKTQKHTFNSEK